ncbi:MAG TPA: hypothetical protein VLT57_18645 [Bryobacteraceae bacterium]|nr:hypothetical protein [Bryobacteraceae bacterium]
MSLPTPRQDEITHRSIARLASLLANGVEIRAGQTYPNGWDFSSGQRLYAIATSSMLQAAQRLIGTARSGGSTHGGQ